MAAKDQANQTGMQCRDGTNTISDPSLFGCGGGRHNRGVESHLTLDGNVRRQTGGNSIRVLEGDLLFECLQMRRLFRELDDIPIDRPPNEALSLRVISGVTNLTADVVAIDVDQGAERCQRVNVISDVPLVDPLLHHLTIPVLFIPNSELAHDNYRRQPRCCCLLFLWQRAPQSFRTAIHLIVRWLRERKAAAYKFVKRLWARHPFVEIQT